MKSKLILLSVLFAFFSCSQRLYYKYAINYNGLEKKATILSLTQKTLVNNERALLTGKFVVENSKETIPALLFYLASKTDTTHIETNKEGNFSFYFNKNSIFKMFIKYVGFEPSVVDSIPLILGKETSIIVELKEKPINY
jgi:hypothetical protein